MQYTKEKLKEQQMVLFHLGFYKGLIDGIWSTASIEAKRMFESRPEYVPANPNGGLPFGERERLPKDMSYSKGMVVHKTLTEERRLEIETGMKARMAATRPRGETPVRETAAVVESGEAIPAAEPEVQANAAAEVQPQHKPQGQHNQQRRR